MIDVVCSTCIAFDLAFVDLQLVNGIVDDDDDDEELAVGTPVRTAVVVDDATVP